MAEEKYNWGDLLGLLIKMERFNYKRGRKLFLFELDLIFVRLQMPKVITRYINKNNLCSTYLTRI